MTSSENEEKSCYSASYGGGDIGIGYIKSIDDILVDIPLRNVCLKIIERFGELKRGHTYAADIIEADEQGSYQPYELILLFKELGLVEKIDRKGFYNQTKYKAVGKRRLEFALNADKVLDFIDRTNGKNSVIKKQALEFIARHIGNLASGNKLVEFFKDLGVPDSLIVYPNTKWRMIYDVLLYYASCPKFEDRKILYKIIEEATHPLMHNGDKNLAEETRKEFNNFLEYDKFWIVDGILWKEFDNGTYEEWVDKDGNRLENTESAFLVLPEIINEIYVYWNELIKLTKFYFNDKGGQDDEINNIYFEIINKVEKLTSTNGNGGLQRNYKRPFGNIIGCEFEAQKQGLSQDALFVKLYDFLGMITNACLPSKENVEKIKKNNTNLFEKIKKYYKEHSPLKQDIRKPKGETPSVKMEIIKWPELKIKNKDIFENPNKTKTNSILQNKFSISVKDREIWVNNFLIGKPHAVGNNYEFFDYVRLQPANTKIEWKTIPDTIGWSIMKEAIKDRRFIKILNAIGFKGEIKKAFFYKVGMNSLFYRGNEIDKENLQNAGIKINLFMKELEAAHAKNCPE